MVDAIDSPLPVPPFDRELKPVLAELNSQVPPTITPEMIVPGRASNPGPPSQEQLLALEIDHAEHTITGTDGRPDMVASVFTRKGHTGTGPGLLHFHGGGMILGNRFNGIDVILEWVAAFDAVGISIEYRLAPEHPDPAPIDDCYAALLWITDNARQLGIDPGKIVVCGESAGGGLAAGTVLLARDRQGPDVAGQILMYPMLDDRNNTVSSHQIDGIGFWDRGSNETAWNALLGERRERGEVSIYAAPARAKDLSRLPPTYLDAGSAEVFRDEIVAYASAIWASGGIAALHVWPGGFHGFDGFAPHSTLGQMMRETRTKWLQTLLR